MPINATKSPAKFLLWADDKSLSYNPVNRLLRTVIRVILICVQEFFKNRLSLRSSALTYTIMLSLVPMLAMSTAIVKGLGGGDHLKEVVYTYLETLEPSSNTVGTEVLPSQEIQSQDISPAPKETSNPAAKNNMTGHLRSAVDQLFAYVDQTNFAALGTFGVLGILFSVLLVFSHIEAAMNTIWQVEKSRPIIRKVSDYLTLMLLMPFSINIGFASNTILSSHNLSSRLDMFFPALWLQALILKLVPIFFVAVTLFIIYLFFPNTKVKSLPAFTGALVGAALWFGIQNIYISMQIGVSNYNAIYGSFASLPLFLVWIYMGWIFILFGAQLAYAIQNSNTHCLVPQNSKPSLLLSAAFDILDMVYKKHQQGEPERADQLATLLPDYTSQLINKTLELLLNHKLLYLTNDNKSLLPATPQENLKNSEIIQAVLGNDTPETAGGKKSRILLSELADKEQKTD